MCIEILKQLFSSISVKSGSILTSPVNIPPLFTSITKNKYSVVAY